MILTGAGGPEKFQTGFTHLVRKAIDAVIDAPHTGRFTLDEIEKTEKTYLGTKIEILFRNLIKASKGKILDLDLNGTEVDIKNTIGKQWSIPPEALNHPCVLIRSSERLAECSVGLIVIRRELLNPGKNRDEKSSISKAGMGSIRWMLLDAPYPKNFWEFLEPPIRHEITTPVGGTNRLIALFQRVQRTPISRAVVESLAQQKDSLKRIRKNGGARDQLAREGIAVLWGRKDRALIAELGLSACDNDQFIAYQPQDLAHIERLRNVGHL